VLDYLISVKDQILAAIQNIRAELSIAPREPKITRIFKKEEALYIECEDRADKSVIIGTGGWVVGKLAQEFDVKNITIESRLDNIKNTRRLIESMRKLSHAEIDYETRSFLLSLIKGHVPTPITALVLGEELHWVCGFLERNGCFPVLLHSGHVDERVKDAYENTTYIKTDVPSTPYNNRIMKMTDIAIRIARERAINLVFGAFEKSMTIRENIILINPERFFNISAWTQHAYEKKKYRAKIYNLSNENKIYLIKKMLEDVYAGFIEPNEAANNIYLHWPGQHFDITFDSMVIGAFDRMYKRRNALKHAAKIAPEIHNALCAFINNSPFNTNLSALVAWSGGIDSTACIFLSKEMGFKTHAATVCLDHIKLEPMERWCMNHDVPHIVLETPKGIEKITKSAKDGKLHPCGRCHKLIENTIIEYANCNGYDVAIFGDMLSSGAQSITKQNGIYIINLPAALALTKHDLELYAEKMADDVFGCSLLDSVYEKNRRFRKVSIQRVLRELRAQVIDKKYALCVIKDIMK